MSFYIALNILFIIIAWGYMIVEPHIKKNQRKYVVIFFIIVFSTLMALRPENTKDTLAYINSFEGMNIPSGTDINLLQKYQGYEWGYVGLVYVFKYFSSSYRLFFFLVALIGTSLSVFGLKKICDILEENNKDYWGSILAIYISSFGMLYNGISTRAGLAMGLGVFAVSLLLQKKNIKGIVLLFLAFIIQRSSFLFIVIYLILKFMPILKKRIYWILWVSAGIIMFSQIGIKIYNQLETLVLAIIDRFNISGYAAFFVGADIVVGLRDIYLWLLFGVLIFIIKNDQKYGKYLNVIMAGTFVVATMYGVRAVARAYDIFYLFMVPSMGAIYRGKSMVCHMNKRIIIYIIMVANAILMLRLCFL